MSTHELRSWQRCGVLLHLRGTRLASNGSLEPYASSNSCPLPCVDPQMRAAAPPAAFFDEGTDPLAESVALGQHPGIFSPPTDALKAA